MLRVKVTTLNTRIRNFFNAVSTQSNLECGRSNLDTFSRIQLRQELLRGHGEPFDGRIELFWSLRETIKSRIIEIDASPSDELQILKANTRCRLNEIIQEFAIAGIVSPHSTVGRVWAGFEQRYGSDVVTCNDLFGKLESFRKIKNPHRIREIENLRRIRWHFSAYSTRFITLKSMDYPHCQKLIWEKMPEDFISRWRKRASNKVLPLSYLLHELEVFLDEYSDPLFASKPINPCALSTGYQSENRKTFTWGPQRQPYIPRGRSWNPR